MLIAWCAMLIFGDLQQHRGNRLRPNAHKLGASLAVIYTGSPLLKQYSTAADLYLVSRVNDLAVVAPIPISVKDVGSGIAGGGKFAAMDKAQIHIQGSNELTSAPKFLFKTTKYSGAAESISMLGLPKAKEWGLFGPFDAMTLPTALAFNLSHRIGMPTPEVRFVEVLLVGKDPVSFPPNKTGWWDDHSIYCGLYMLTPQISSKMVTHAIGEKKIDFKFIVRADQKGQCYKSSVTGLSLCPTIPKLPTLEQHAFAAQFFDQLEENLFGDCFFSDAVAGSVADAGSTGFIDWAAFIDFFLLQELVQNSNGYCGGFYLHLSSHREQLGVGPVWDFQHSFGQLVKLKGSSAHFKSLRQWMYQRAMQKNLPTGSGECDSSKPNLAYWIQRLLTRPEFRVAAANRWKKLRAKEWSDASLDLTNLPGSVLPFRLEAKAIERSGRRWAGVATGGMNESTIEAMVVELSNSLMQRAKWIDGAVAELAWSNHRCEASMSLQFLSQSCACAAGFQAVSVVPSSANLAKGMEVTHWPLTLALPYQLSLPGQTWTSAKAGLDGVHAEVKNVAPLWSGLYTGPGMLSFATDGASTPSSSEEDSSASATSSSPSSAHHPRQLMPQHLLRAAFSFVPAHTHPDPADTKGRDSAPPVFPTVPTLARKTMPGFVPNGTSASMQNVSSGGGRACWWSRTLRLPTEGASAFGCSSLVQTMDRRVVIGSQEDHPPGEVAQRLLDGNPNSKWLKFRHHNNESTWIVVCVGDQKSSEQNHEQREGAASHGTTNKSVPKSCGQRVYSRDGYTCCNSCTLFCPEQARRNASMANGSAFNVSNTSTASTTSMASCAGGSLATCIKTCPLYPPGAYQMCVSGCTARCNTEPQTCKPGTCTCNNREFFDVSAAVAGWSVTPTPPPPPPVPASASANTSALDVPIARAYSLTSGSDAPERDPAHWQLDAWNGSAWVTIDERRGEIFSARSQTRRFCIADAARMPGHCYRLLILNVSDPIAAWATQLSGFDLDTSACGCSEDARLMLSKRSYALSASGMVADLDRRCKEEFTLQSHVARWDDPFFGSDSTGRDVVQKRQVSVGPDVPLPVSCSGQLGVPVFMKSDPTDADQEYVTGLLKTVRSTNDSSGSQLVPLPICAAQQRILCSEGQSAEQCANTITKLGVLDHVLSRYATQLLISHGGNYSFSVTAAYNMGQRLFMWVDEKLAQAPVSPAGTAATLVSVMNSSLVWLEPGWHSLR
jgi:hypothetical protein